MSAKPIFRFAGGKRQLLPRLRPFIPQSFNRYFEPFVGGGAVFFDIAPEMAIINDINRPLMITYHCITRYPAIVLERAQKLIEQFDEDHYYQTRHEFNEMRDLLPRPHARDAIRMAARFIYLNRTCFNGLWRENAAGEMNTPIGKFTKKPSLDTSNFLEGARILQFATLSAVDFEEVITDVDAGDLIYFDPPYIPTGKNGFVNFTADGFTIDDQRRLANAMETLHNRGAYVILSNSDTELTEELFGNMIIHRVSERRAINSDTTNRGHIRTIIVSNFKSR
jgi:DNA adenine methylase